MCDFYVSDINSDIYEGMGKMNEEGIEQKFRGVMR